MSNLCCYVERNDLECVVSMQTDSEYFLFHFICKWTMHNIKHNFQYGNYITSFGKYGKYVRKCVNIEFHCLDFRLLKPLN